MAKNDGWRSACFKKLGTYPNFCNTSKLRSTSLFWVSNRSRRRQQVSTIGMLTMSRCQLCAISQSATTGLVVSSVDLLRLGKPVRFGPVP
jgi:hypothetical protein